jgi:hypothetical protein
LAAVWRGGVLWTSGNDDCIPPGDSTDRACLLLIQVATTSLGGTPSVLQDFDVTSVGAYLYFPAVTVDGYGDLFVAYSRSSAQMYASVLTLHQLVNAPNSLGSSLLVQPGQGTYVGPGLVQRWGDYSAAAVDPTNTADVWVTGEYAGPSTDLSDWGTVAVRVAVRPIISSITPNSGQANGSQAVSINGSYFQSGATLSFGSASASGMSVTNGTQITATTPRDMELSMSP